MCHINTATIAADGQAVATAITQIANALKATNETLAADLTTAAAALVAATSNWKTGDAVDDINTAAGVIESILAAIPVTAPYAGFVAIAVSALDILIANLSTQSAQTGSTVKNALVVAHAVTATPEDNPYHGVVTIKRHFMEGYKGAAVRTWNTHVDETAEPGFTHIG